VLQLSRPTRVLNLWVNHLCTTVCRIDCGWTLILPWRFLFCSFALKHAWSPPYGTSFCCRREWLQWLVAWFNVSGLPFICRSMMRWTSPYLSRVTTVIPHSPVCSVCPFQHFSYGAEPRDACFTQSLIGSYVKVRVCCHQRYLRLISLAFIYSLRI